jgi:hemerythrin
MEPIQDFVEWGEQYMLHIPYIDDQHKHLIDLTNELFRACLESEDAAKAQFARIIPETVDYVKVHFDAEEKLLRTVGYPDLEAHRRSHAGFVQTVLAEVQSFHEGRKFVPNAFARFLRDWVLSHIALEDKRYARFIYDLKKEGKLGK